MGRGLPHRRLGCGLARIDLAARAVDLARAEASQLTDQEHLALVNHEEEGGAVLRLPALPIDAVEIGCWWVHRSDIVPTLAIADGIRNTGAGELAPRSGAPDP